MSGLEHGGWDEAEDAEEPGDEEEQQESFEAAPPSDNEGNESLPLPVAHQSETEDETAVEASDYELTSDTPTDTDSDRDVRLRSRNVRGRPPRNPPTQAAQQLLGEQHVGAQRHAPILLGACPENNEAADVVPAVLTSRVKCKNYASASSGSEAEVLSQDELSSASHNGNRTVRSVSSRSEAEEHLFQFSLTESENEAGFLESDVSDDDFGSHLQRHMPNVSASRSVNTRFHASSNASTSSQTLTQPTLNSPSSSAATSVCSQTLKTLKFEDIAFNGSTRKRRTEVNHTDRQVEALRDVDTVDITVPLDERVTPEECVEATNNQLPSFNRLLSDRVAPSSMDVQGAPTIYPMFSETVSKAPEQYVKSGSCVLRTILGEIPWLMKPKHCCGYYWLQDGSRLYYGSWLYTSQLSNTTWHAYALFFVGVSHTKSVHGGFAERLAQPTQLRAARPASNSSKCSSCQLNTSRMLSARSRLLFSNT